MVDAFATVADLEARLDRTFSIEETAMVETLLEDASTYLRSIIGQEIYPRRQATATLWPSAGRVDIPQQPLVSVDAVKRGTVNVAFKQHPGFITVDGDEPVSVTFTFGFVDAPEDLKRWTCVLVSQALLPIEAKLGMSVAGVSSVAIDDFRIAFADGGDQAGMQLSERAMKQLREQYGRTVYVA